MAIPKNIDRGTYTEGQIFKALLSSYIQWRRKHMMKEIRKMITQKLNEKRRSIYKIVVTDESICFLDKHDKLIIEL